MRRSYFAPGLRRTRWRCSRPRRRVYGRSRMLQLRSRAHLSEPSHIVAVPCSVLASCRAGFRGRRAGAFHAKQRPCCVNFRIAKDIVLFSPPSVLHPSSFIHFNCRPFAVHFRSSFSPVPFFVPLYLFRGVSDITVGNSFFF